MVEAFVGVGGLVCSPRPEGGQERPVMVRGGYGERPARQPGVVRQFRRGRRLLGYGVQFFGEAGKVVDGGKLPGPVRLKFPGGKPVG